MKSHSLPKQRLPKADEQATDNYATIRMGSSHTARTDGPYEAANCN
jgi:hypothetical protein